MDGVIRLSAASVCLFSCVVNMKLQAHMSCSPPARALPASLFFPAEVEEWEGVRHDFISTALIITSLSDISQFPDIAGPVVIIQLSMPLRRSAGKNHCSILPGILGQQDVSASRSGIRNGKYHEAVPRGTITPYLQGWFVVASPLTFTFWL